MKIDYDVGDVVVCVNGDPHPEWVVYLANAGVRYVLPEKGKFYTVTEIEFDWRGVGVRVAELQIASTEQDNGFLDGTRFRKLPKADAEFTEQMRRCKPGKRKVDA